MRVTPAVIVGRDVRCLFAVGLQCGGDKGHTSAVHDTGETERYETVFGSSGADSDFTVDDL